MESRTLAEFTETVRLAVPGERRAGRLPLVGAAAPDDRAGPATSGAGRGLAVPALAVAPDACQLVCFPHAGGDAPSYAGLADAVAPELEVWALRLPGRGGRFGVPMPRRFDLLVADLVDGIAGWLRPGSGLLRAELRCAAGLRGGPGAARRRCARPGGAGLRAGAG